MKLKKIAVRGLIAVAVGVALCMFFSGTIENITTPKVKLAKASRGKLVESLELDASLAYPSVVDQKLSLPAGQTLTIKRVNVRPGYAVKAGDVVLEASVTGYEAAAQLAQDEYDAALDAMMELERKNEGLTLRRSEEAYAGAYAALRAATQDAARKKTEMEVLLRAAKLTLPAEGHPEGASDELIAAIGAYRAAVATQETAQEEFNRAARYGVSDEVWAYITAHQSAQEKIDESEEKLIALEELNRSAAAITAPHDGVISAISLTAGMAYDGTLPLYTITAEGTTPALRAELGDTDKAIKEGMKLTVDFGSESANAKITALGFNENGKRYAEVGLDDELLRRAGSLYNLSTGGATFLMEFKAAESTCLLPASAVRGSGDSRYVYTVNETTGTFGKRKLNLSKMEVTVIAEAGGMASIEEDLSYYSIAYMEDRALSDGSGVMEYVE